MKNWQAYGTRGTVLSLNTVSYEGNNGKHRRFNPRPGFEPDNYHIKVIHKHVTGLPTRYSLMFRSYWNEKENIDEACKYER